MPSKQKLKLAKKSSYSGIKIATIFFITSIIALVPANAAASLNPASWPAKIGEILVGFFLQIILLFANVVLSIGNGLLSWVVGNPFSLSYTNPAKNQIISIGWTLIKDLTNMGFILGLVYIALATALRLNAFKTGTIFAKLILIAILINFSPVLCGLVVDAANILTNYFLEGVVGFDAFGQVFKLQGSNLMETLIGPPSLEPLMKTVFLAAYGFVGGFILLVFALILLARYFIIWVFVILSPLAFFAWIFPTTKKYFDQWLGQFLKWSFISVPAGFFLYLAQQFLAYADKEAIFSSASGLSGNTSFIVPLMPYIGSMIFLIIALVITSKLNVAGVNLLMKAGKIGLAATGAGAAAAAMGYAGRLAESTKAEAQAFAQKAEQKGKGTFSRFAYGAVGAIKGGTMGIGKGILTGTKEGARAGAGRAFPYLTRQGRAKTQRKAITKHKTNLSGLNPDELKNIATTSYNPRERAAAVELLGESGDFDFTEAQAENLVKEASANGANLSNLVKSRPELTPHVYADKTNNLIQTLKAQGMSDSEAETKAKQRMIEQQISSMSPEDIRKNIHQISLANTDVLTAMDPKQINELANKGNQSQKNILKQVKRAGAPVRSALVAEARQAHDAGDKQRRHNILRTIKTITNNPDIII